MRIRAIVVGLIARTTATLATATCALTVIPTVYLGVLTAVGLPGSRRRRSTDAPPTVVFVIVIPAHDEAAGIVDTLRSLDDLDYPRELYSVHVVADNCTDTTAEVVRSTGWTAHERQTPDRGKGPAINWLLDRLDATADSFDAVVVVDADTCLDPGFLLAADAAVRDGALVAQGRYSVREPAASSSTSFRYAALACRHHLRPLARNRLGASCGLFGNGMVFRADIVRRRRWTGHLVEDAELQMQLLLDGVLVEYVPEAVLEAEMPTTLERAESQNERWERGRLDLARRYLPVLARRLVTGRRQRIATLDAAFDQLLPPVSVLACAQLAAAACSATAYGLKGSRPMRRATELNVIAIGLTVAHVLAGLWAVRAAPTMYVNLLRAPRLMLWKVRLWLSVLLLRSDVEWTRTQRNR